MPSCFRLLGSFGPSWFVVPSTSATQQQRIHRSEALELEKILGAAVVPPWQNPSHSSGDTCHPGPTVSKLKFWKKAWISVSSLYFALTLPSFHFQICTLSLSALTLPPHSRLRRVDSVTADEWRGLGRGHFHLRPTLANASTTPLPMPRHCPSWRLTVTLVDASALASASTLCTSWHQCQCRCRCWCWRLALLFSPSPPPP